MEVELESEEHAVDLLLYLEGMNCLLVAAHHYFNEEMTFPSVLEQNQINAFGPISRSTAENYLKPGQCLIRRSPEMGKSKVWVDIFRVSARIVQICPWALLSTKISTPSQSPST